MKDRVPKYPGRVKLTPVPGATDLYDMERADQPTQEGTPLNKDSLLTDKVATAFGLNPSTATVNDALEHLGVNPYLWNGPKKLSSLPMGSLVKLKEDGQDEKFIVLDVDHYGPGTGVTLIRKNAFTEIAWNASRGDIRQNRYFGCTLDNFCDGIWPQKLDPEIRECIVPVPIIVAEGNEVAILRTIYRKAFALSCTEVGLSGWQTEGTAFSYFNNSTNRRAYMFGTNTNVSWGLRSPYSSILEAYSINPDGTQKYRNIYLAYFAPRPAFNLRPDMVASGTPDSDGCYTLVKKEDA